MKWKVKITEKLFQELNNYLFSKKPLENGCFIMGKTINEIFFLSKIIYPKKDYWLTLENELCSPNAEYISHACIQANINDYSLLFVHSHPNKGMPKTFSKLDEYSNEKLFKNIFPIIRKPIGSIVMTEDSIHGIINNNGSNYQISDYTIYGKNINIITDYLMPNTTLDTKVYDRQIRFMKKKELDVLSYIKVAIIGAGGTGSPLAVMLSKMGVSHIDLFDHDKIEAHNLPRIYGANHNDIGKYKVDVVASHIKSFSECILKPMNIKVNDSTDFSNYDIIFGCIDNHTTRDIINKASYKYAIPFIDTGCSIPLDKNKNISQAVISINTVTPNNPCLWCTNTLDGIIIMEESLSKDELISRQEDGYRKSIDKAPSVITLTTSVATFAINRMLNVIGVLSDIYPPKVMFDFNKTILFEPETKINPDCQCQKLNPFS